MTFSNVKPVIVVSGLPRSGTSLMMQILAAGGVPVVADGDRPADDSNPRGYFEESRVRGLHLDTSWLSEVRGKAIKIVSPLLHHLPVSEEYHILFMERPLDQIMASQRTMLQRLGKADDAEPADLKDRYQMHLRDVQRFCETHPRMKVLTVDYPELVANPIPQIGKIEAFLRIGLLHEGIHSVIDPQLHHHRNL